MNRAIILGRSGRRRSLLAALAGLLALSLPLAAQTFPALTGHVVDDAGVLDAGARQALAAKLAALEAKTSDQVVVATVRSLEGYAVEDYANRLFRAWRLGQKDQNNGVLLLLAPTEHKVRIEVGYGLEGTLPDAVSKLIIEERMVSRLRANQFDGAIASAVDGIIDVLTGDAAEWKQRAAKRPQARPQGHDAGAITPLSAWHVVFFLLCFGFGGYILFGFLVRELVAIHLLPQYKDRHGWWHWLDRFDDGLVRSTNSRAAWASSSSSSWSTPSSSSSSWSDSSSSSGSSDSYSGGGGSSGGGGASGSW
jgi:uncharacterized protein